MVYLLLLLSGAKSRIPYLILYRKPGPWVWNCVSFHVRTMKRKRNRLSFFQTSLPKTVIYIFRKAGQAGKEFRVQPKYFLLYPQYRMHIYVVPLAQGQRWQV